MIVVIPLMLSIAIGFWYMTIGDVITAWTLSLYIVTAAAGKSLAKKRGRDADIK